VVVAAAMGVNRNFSRGQRQNFAYPSYVFDDAMQMDVYKTLYPCHSITKIHSMLRQQSKIALRWQQ